MKTTSIHIVRRYGPVGGMENYVFELTQALAEKGQTVIVLCEICDVSNDGSQIQVILLRNRLKKPRWLAQWYFSKSVSRYIEASKLKGTIIHSHERSSVHQVTTFHGPPFLNRKKRLLDFLSPRIFMWTALEKKELLGTNVKAILPNSTLIADQLAIFYPSIKHKITQPAYPGVSELYYKRNKANLTPTIGFIGHEWKRKGLDIACLIVRELLIDLPKLHFLVAGCNPKEIIHLFKGFPKGSYTLTGWINNPELFIEKTDLLLHPAKAEPFGMAIAEANASGIPVVISEHCGIASLINADHGKVCKLDMGSIAIEPWVKACKELLIKPIEVKSLNLSWKTLADQHIKLYRSLQN